MAASSNWQDNKSLAECNRHMLENDLATDVTFLVSNDARNEVRNKDGASEAHRINAHKYMLITRSSVFYAMFCGDMAEKGVIVINDVEPYAFMEMLSYIYTDEVNIKPELVMFILYVSKKYQLPGLSAKCTDYLKDNLHASNACAILDQSLFYDEKDLIKRCLMIIKANTKSSMESESILSIHQATLSNILDSNIFSIKEVDVFILCLKWAKHQCQENFQDLTGVNLRNVLGDCVSKFRFPDMEMSDFSGIVAPSDILTDQQEIAIFRYIGNKKLNPPPEVFSSESRFLPGPYDVFTEEPIQAVNINQTVLKTTIMSDADLKIKALVIGSLNNSYCNLTHTQHVAAINVVNYNGQTVRGSARNINAEKQEWAISSDVVIIAGEPSTLSLTFRQNCNRNCAMNLRVVNKNQIKLKDKLIEVELKSDQQWMSLLGFKYELV